MATSLPFWFLLPTDSGGGFFPLWLGVLRVTSESAESGQGALIGRMMAGSIVTTLPVIVLFLFAKRYLQHTVDAGDAGSVPSTR
jgi:ABC-type glycerol-3-phosphate transport system permease component